MQASVDVGTAASLMGVTERTIQKRVAASDLPALKERGAKGGGAGGELLRIPVDALPPEAQLKYFEMAGKSDSAAMDADLVSYREKYGDKELTHLLTRRRLVLIAKGIRENNCGDVQKRMEALAKENNTTMRTIYRWEQAYAADGLKGIMKQPRKDAGEPRTMCLEARRYIWSEFLQPNRRTQETALRKTRDRADIEGPKACENCLFREGSAARAQLSADDLPHFPACDQAGNGLIVPPNRSSVSRVIAQLTPAEKAYLREGRKKWEADFMFKNKRTKPEEVNLCWFGDHHQFDCFALNQKGKPVRPWLTAWYDIGSGQMVGHVISECPNSQTIMEAFTRAVAQKRSSNVCGLPVYVYTDNGKDYRCERFEGGRFTEVNLGDLNEKVRMSSMGADGIGTESIYSLFDVQTIHAKEYHGWAKPVERWFLTLEHRFIRELPGYCGGKPSERPENFDRTLQRLTERGELLTMDELYEKFTREMLPMYNESPHDGYGGQTPAWRYANLPKARNDVPSWSMLALAKDEQENRKVGTWGVRFKNRWYWDYELTSFTGQYVQIRYNRDCLDSLTICTIPERGKSAKFICEAEPKEELAMVNEDEEKLKRYVAIPKIQERELRQGLITKGVKMPGKRSSGNVYVDDVDVEYAKGNITQIAYDRVWIERENARKRKADRDEAVAGADEASAHFRRMGAELLKQVKHA